MFRLIRFYYWYLFGTIRRHKFSYLAVILTLSIVLSNRSFLAEKVLLNPVKRVFSKFDRQYYTEGVVGFPKVINPLFSTSEIEKDINELVFNSLVEINSSGEIKPELAEKFNLVGDREYVCLLYTSPSPRD